MKDVTEPGTLNFHLVNIVVAYEASVIRMILWLLFYFASNHFHSPFGLQLTMAH